MRFCLPRKNICALHWAVILVHILRVNVRNDSHSIFLRFVCTDCVARGEDKNPVNRTSFSLELHGQGKKYLAR